VDLEVLSLFRRGILYECKYVRIWVNAVEVQVPREQVVTDDEKANLLGASGENAWVKVKALQVRQSILIGMTSPKLLQ
jgi:hypothetical protein